MNMRDKALRLQAEHERNVQTRTEAVNRAVDAIEAFTEAKFYYERAYIDGATNSNVANKVDETREQMREALTGLVPQS